jgi:hypothetical protein
MMVQNKVRKIYRPKINARAVNLSPYLPDDWEYVEVHLNAKTPSCVVLTLIVVRVDKLDVRVSGKILKAVK